MLLFDVSSSKCIITSECNCQKATGVCECPVSIACNCGPTNNTYWNSITDTEPLILNTVFSNKSSGEIEDDNNEDFELPKTRNWFDYQIEQQQLPLVTGYCIVADDEHTAFEVRREKLLNAQNFKYTTGISITHFKNYINKGNDNTFVV